VTGNKNLHKELKRPDLFQVEVARLGDWIVKYRNSLLTYGLAPILILVVAGIGYQKVQEHRTEARITELSNVDVIYEKELANADKQRKEIQDKISKLDKKVKPAVAGNDKGQAQADGKAADGGDDDKAMQADKDKLIAEIKAVKADHKESLAAYEKFYANNHGNPEGWRSAAKAVSIYLENKNYTAAAGLAESVLKESPSLDFYKVQFRLLYVSILEELDRYDDALAQIEPLVKTADETIMPKVLLSKGRLQILKNAKSDAKATFDSLIAKHGNSTEAQKAKSILALWN
jgi:tetratricopeptide (TPR) repeat protein